MIRVNFDASDSVTILHVYFDEASKAFSFRPRDKKIKKSSMALKWPDIY